MVQSAPAVRHAARIVQVLADSPRAEFTLSEISRSVGLNKTSCLSILASLTEAGSVVKHPGTLRYSIGPVHIGLGFAASKRYDFIDVARVELDRLCQEDGLYWDLGTLSGMEMMVLATSESRPPLLTWELGKRFALTPPIGFVFICWSAPELAEAWLRQAVRDAGTNKLEEFRAALEATRRRGFSVGIESTKQAKVLTVLGYLGEHGENSKLADEARALLDDVALDEFLLGDIEPEQSYGVSFLSAPVADDEGMVIASVTIGGFSAPLSGHELSERGEALVSCARRVASAYPRNEVSSHRKRMSDK
jgi:DNA-binding IclR family transcriptional regulator